VSRIVFAWELGGGLGHLAPFRPIAERLAARGHEVTLAVRDVERVNTVFDSRAVRVVQAPICVKTYGGLAEPPLNYAEILMRYGYLDAPLLGGLLRAWRGLLDLARADVVIADHAPTALLAARARGTPRALFGITFSVPPAVSPTPGMRSWVQVPRERLASSDASVLDAINRCLDGQAPRLAALHEIFDGALRLYLGLPELDAYGPRDPGDYLGLYTAVAAFRPVTWPEGEGPRIFVYLHADYSHVEAALAALERSGARCFVYLLGGTPAHWQKYQGPRLAFSAEPVNLDAAVADCDLYVGHGGSGAAMSVLRAGKPMLLLPSQLEQFLLASILEKLGVARLVHPDAQPPDIAGTLGRALGEPGLARAAREFALRQREPAVDTIAERTAGRIEALARQGTG
jgi:UDP:flavonoid glycosyltransferase YjiC (YdhE family)